ncbi:uncharacterized protein LOC143198942 isoform X2 [Rhynchophorus ferrugineus]|uniref:uncharacterized protein LOC143198942 isoform X2 n=1 Tax=Rhynchophorus ferrugineus TaxID=354439 RepID=UPI003FCD4341
MALVAYDTNSESENEISDEDINSKVSIDETVTNKKSTLFSKLPYNTKLVQGSKDDVNDALEDFIPTVKTLKETKKVQIPIPSLSDFHDLDDEPQKKKVKKSQKGSGLLGILPPIKTTPCSNTSFIPKSVVNRNISISKNKEHRKKKNSTSMPKKKHFVSDSDTDDEDINLPDTFDDEMWTKVCGRPKSKTVTTVSSESDNSVNTESIVDIAPDPEKPYDGLDNTAFKELVGKSKMPVGNIKLIDINEEEILPDKDLWMTKSLTDPEMAPKLEIDNPVDPTRRKKHHITYLAQQAKANEQELKSAWATSKNNRMMSRAKYGF